MNNVLSSVAWYFSAGLHERTICVTNRRTGVTLTLIYCFNNNNSNIQTQSDLLRREFCCYCCCYCVFSCSIKTNSSRSNHQTRSLDVRVHVKFVAAADDELNFRSMTQISFEEDAKKQRKKTVTACTAYRSGTGLNCAADADQVPFVCWFISYQTSSSSS